MLIWYFSNNLDINDYVGKLPEQHFSVGLFSNPGDKILFLLKFTEARISEWNLTTTVLCLKDEIKDMKNKCEKGKEVINENPIAEESSF